MGGGNGITLLYQSWSGEFTPLTEEGTLSSCVPGFHQTPALALCPSCLSGSTVLFFFISGIQLGFKTPNLRDPVQRRPGLIL